MDTTPSTSRGMKRKGQSEAIPTRKLSKGKTLSDEKFFLSELQDEDIQKCLLELENEDASPMLSEEEEVDDPAPVGSSAFSADVTLARAMSEALSAVIANQPPSPTPIENEQEAAQAIEEEMSVLGPSIYPLPTPHSPVSPAEDILQLTGPSFFPTPSPAFPLPPSSPTPPSPPPAIPGPSRVSPPPSATAIPVNWNVDPSGQQPSFPFTGSPGLKIIPEMNSPVDYFSLIFTDEFFQLLVRETNDFAVILLTEKSAGRPRSRISDWKDVTVDEMKKFLGLVFLSGVIKISRWSEYWSRDKLFRIPIFAQTMGRDRFLAILAALHFARNPDPDSAPPTDISPIHKLLPLLECFHDNMKNVHEAGKILCIDESMAPWRGRLRFRQYMPGKSHKYGVKLYMLTEPDGLIHKFIIYAGAEDKEVAGAGHAKKVVHKLLSGYEGSGRSLFMDNFYNSVELTRDLLSKNIHVTGTLRANRKYNPVDVTQRKLKKGEVIQRWSDEGINVAKWRDRRDVLTISSEFSGDLATTSNRRGQSLTKPEVVLKYNDSMGGIDRADQLLSYYIATRKSLKWYKKLGFHIMEIMLLNSFILFHRYSGDRMDLYGFRKAIIHYLIGPEPLPQPAARVSRGENDLYINPVHFPKTLAPSDTTKEKYRNRKMSKRCRGCLQRNLRKTVTTYCPGCPDHPGLCLDCFVGWHVEVKGMSTTS